MAAFTTESAVRLRFQVADTTQMATEIVTAAINEAHDSLLRWLQTEWIDAVPPIGLVLGETLLAGARLFRLLAAKEAFDCRDVRVGNQQVGGTAR
jgi:hypothetical protein